MLKKQDTEKIINIKKTYYKNQILSYNKSIESLSMSLDISNIAFSYMQSITTAKTASQIINLYNDYLTTIKHWIKYDLINALNNKNISVKLINDIIKTINQDYKILTYYEHDKTFINEFKTLDTIQIYKTFKILHFNIKDVDIIKIISLRNK